MQVITVGEAKKLLKDYGFVLLNRRGSHRKYGKGDYRITIISHNDSPKERLSPGASTHFKKFIEQFKNQTNEDKNR